MMGEKLKTDGGAGKRFRVLHAVSAKGNDPKSIRLGAITSTISSGTKQMKCCSATEVRKIEEVQTYHPVHKLPDLGS